MDDFVQLAPFRPANALDFSPVQNALAQVTAQNNANRQYGLQQQQSNRADQELELNKQTTASQLQAAALAHEQNLARAYGGWAQTIAGNPDPNARATMTKTMIASHPEFAAALTKNGVDPNDTDNALKFITSEALGYQNPQDVALKNAQIAGLNAENALRGKSFTTTGHDAYGQPTFGVVDLTKPNGGIPAPAAGQGATNTLTPNGQGVTGADYLATLPKPMADQVKAIAEGRMPMPSGFALKTPYWQQMITRVSQYDPTFDAVNYNARAKTRADFTSGKSAQNITSFNTAIGHLDALDQAVDGLGNGAFPSLNAAKNAAAGITGNTAQQTAIANFQTARNAVKEELTRAFKGSGGSLTEVEGWDKELDAAASPEALHAVVKKAVDLLGSRLDAVGDQYNKGMGTTADPVTLLNPKAQKIWARLSGGTPAAPAAGGTANPAAAPAPSGTPLAAPKTQADYDALPSGTRYTDPNGTPRVKP